MGKGAPRCLREIVRPPAQQVMAKAQAVPAAQARRRWEWGRGGCPPRHRRPPYSGPVRKCCSVCPVAAPFIVTAQRRVVCGGGRQEGMVDVALSTRPAPVTPIAPPKACILCRRRERYVEKVGGLSALSPTVHDCRPFCRERRSSP